MRTAGAVVVLWAVAACSTPLGDAQAPRSDSKTTAAGGESGDHAAVPSAGDTSGGTTGSGQQVLPGQLTAGAWDDNLNFDYYLSYLEKIEATGIAGLPKVPRADRLTVTVSDGAGQAVAGATVRVRRAGQTLFEAPTASDGRVLFFPAWAGVGAQEALTIEASTTAGAASASAKAGDAAVALQLAAAQGVTALDVAVVLDTTGSMGDEMEYLKVEVDAIAATVAQRYPHVSQRWALVVYKDVADTFVERHYDFADVASFKASLEPYGAEGGGDYPEAPEVGLSAAAGLSWRGGATARMAFLVADAPQHDGREGALLDAIGRLRAKGVRMYPVAASGVDDLTEYSMRTAAELTGGRYLFLTNDSGIGGDHQEPTLPCYVVTRLDHAMARMISMELGGTYLAPTAAEAIRTGGDPTDGRCRLPDGRVVQVF